MITDNEILEFLDGEMNETKRHSFLQEVMSNEEDRKLLEEYDELRQGIKLIGVLNSVEEQLEAEGFFNEARKINLRSAMTIAASALFICFSAVLFFSNSNYNRSVLVNENLATFGGKNVDYKLNSKGEGGNLPRLSPVDQYSNPLMNTVVEALNDEKFAIALSKIETGRSSDDLREVDQMHLDWLEIQIMLLEDGDKEMADSLIETIAEDRTHYYNSEARELAKKLNSIWSLFVIE